jgi:hypothetical protein
VIALLAVHLGVAPSVLWQEEPTDLATMIDVIIERHG